MVLVELSDEEFLTLSRGGRLTVRNHGGKRESQRWMLRDRRHG